MLTELIQKKAEALFDDNGYTHLEVIMAHDRRIWSEGATSMLPYMEKVSIAFAIWKDAEGWKLNPYKSNGQTCWYCIGDFNERILLSSELYALFTQSEEFRAVFEK